VRPGELAAELGIESKRLRDWLRKNHPRREDEKHARWVLDDAIVAAARTYFRSRRDRPLQARTTTVRSKRSRSESSDEAYVIDLCDEVLGERGLRQHRFEWLQGDADSKGRTIGLPVDAFYPAHSLVVEYRERQHDEPVPIMDSRATVSGVDRSTQRGMYDRRREELIPQHRLRLVVIRPDDLDSDTRKRLCKRDRTADAAAIARLVAMT
jgi:hypothetical protein